MSSKRTFQRKVQKERERLARLLAGASSVPEQTTDDTLYSSEAEVLNEEEEVCVKNVYSFDQSPPESLREKEHNEILNLLGELNRKMDTLSNKFEDFKTDVRKQNSLTVSVLGDNNIALKNAMKSHSPVHTNLFPIQTLDDLEKLNNSINDRNEQEYIASIKAVVGRKGLKKGLGDILAPKLMVKFNADGSHDKLRLLSYDKFINVLFLGSYDQNYSDKSFKTDLKYAIRVVKNRHFKEVSVKKKLLREANDSAALHVENSNCPDSDSS